MTTAPETAPADSNADRPAGPSPEQRFEMLRGRIAQLEHAGRVTEGAHRIAYAAVLHRDVILQRVRDAETLDEMHTALEALEPAAWSAEALPVDADTLVALAEHLWQHCQKHTGAGAIYDDPRRIAFAAVDFLRALWRLPDPDAPPPDDVDEAAELNRETLAKVRFWRRRQDGDEVLLGGLDEILAARTAAQVRGIGGRRQPTTYAEAVEAHRELREERRGVMDEIAAVWDQAEAGAVALIEHFAPDESDEVEAGDNGEPETGAPSQAWADKWQGQRESLREQLEKGVTDDPEFVGRVICPEGDACPRGIVATFKPRSDGSVPMHRYDVGGEECAGVGAKPAPLRLADADEGAPDA